MAASSPSPTVRWADGGWVATHEDVTEQHLAELQRTSMRELESRRAVTEDAIAGFRERVEGVLQSVSDAGQAMQSTAVGLLDSSKRASQRAESAVKASSEASANVATAATAATELSPRSPRSAISSPVRARWCGSQ